MMEAIIALAVVVLVTASALSIANSSTTSRVKAIDKNKAINCAHNIIECFKVSDNNEDLSDKVFWIDSSVRLNWISESDAELDINDYKITVNVTVNVDENFSTITVTVTEGEKSIVDLSYTKYVEGGES